MKKEEITTNDFKGFTRALAKAQVKKTVPKKLTKKDLEKPFILKRNA